MKSKFFLNFIVCARAAVLGWLPASLIFGLLLFFDGVGPGFLATKLSIEQTAYMAALVSIAGALVSPFLGLLFGLPLLLAIQFRKSQSQIFWSLFSGAVIGFCVSFRIFGVSLDAIPAGFVCAVTFALCSYMATRFLKRDVLPAT
jgi:hypothetical protein